MRYKFLTLVIPGLLVTFTAQAAFQSCGDGNQLYTQAKHGDTVRYFASINEFEVTRISDTRVRVEDSVDCRYGTDTLENIGTIEFLDSTVDTNELVQHNNTKNLARSIIQSVLSSRLATQIRSAGGNPDQVNQDDSTPSSQSVSVTTNTNATYTPNANFSLSGSGSGSTNTSSYGTYSNSYSPYNSYTPTNYSTYSAYSNPYSTYGNYSQTGASVYSNSNWYSNYQNQSGAGTFNVEWSTVNVGANDTVYIEAVTASGNRHYLGTAVGYQANKRVSVPASLIGVGEVTIQVRSSARLLSTYSTSF